MYEQLRKEKHITDTQTLVYEKRGTNKTWFEKELIFYGNDTKDFFADLAKAGFNYPIIAYFIGSKIDSQKKKVFIAGNFPFEQWIKRHANRMKGWTFEKIRMRKALPGRSEENDSLAYKIDGMDILDFWEEHFVPTDTEEDQPSRNERKSNADTHYYARREPKHYPHPLL